MTYKSIYWEDVEVGQELPPYHKDVTATTVLAGALASRDYMPVHHDKDFANKNGAPDIFMNILTSGGWVGGYLTRWSGPEAEIKKVVINLGVPCFPGFTFDWRGKVVKKYVEKGEHLVDIEYAAAVPIGFHCRGVGTLALPTKTAKKASTKASAEVGTKAGSRRQQ